MGVSGEAKDTGPCLDGNEYFSAEEEPGGKKVEEGARPPGALMALRFPARAGRICAAALHTAAEHSDLYLWSGSAAHLPFIGLG